MGRRKNKIKESRKIEFQSLTKDEFIKKLDNFKPHHITEEIMLFINYNNIQFFQYGHRPGSRFSIYKVCCKDGNVKIWRSRHTKIVF
ncbi:MAG: hypothetical protein IKF52_01840 [Clostridia bacterium]|nr:hypothetical protein [Clostridia bacterium]